jgi:4-phospho-D-threonate 3-dehydrogenase / 4-phospho-D-erythronate 3-dehydrogenase
VTLKQRESVVINVKPRIAITAGDPAGIGPEIARKAAADPRVREICDPVIYGPPPDATFEPGVLSPDAGRAAYDAICAAVRDAQAGVVHAVATAPVNKLAFARAGLPWKGHTDLLAHLTGSPRAAMMFWSEPLKVVLATVHVPLAEVPRMLTGELLREVIELTAHEMPRFGIPRPRWRG